MLNKIIPKHDGQEICSRAKLDTGTFCNYTCTFCYYRDKLDLCDSFDIVKERVDYLVECGITEVDLSGGESSYHPNWFEILDYCQSKGLRISTVSNGSMFADFDFIQKSEQHGLKEILFSIHGSNPKMHDKVVGVEGAFNKIILAIMHSKFLGIRVRINYVVTLHSIESTKEWIRLFRDLAPFEVNFLTLNNFGIAKQRLSYEKSTTHIKHIIDKIKYVIQYINVRYTPYCYMEGYEKYVCNTFQHIYDLYDWNMAVYDQRVEPTEYKRDPLKSLYEQAKIDRERMYFKPQKCLGCKFLALCDGLENGCGDDVYPIEGSIITNTNEYRGTYYDSKHTDSDAQKTRFI